MATVQEVLAEFKVELPPSAAVEVGSTADGGASSPGITSNEGSEAFLAELTSHVFRRFEEHNEVNAKLILTLFTSHSWSISILTS